MKFRVLRLKFRVPRLKFRVLRLKFRVLRVIAPKRYCDRLPKTTLNLHAIALSCSGKANRKTISFTVLHTIANCYICVRQAGTLCDRLSISCTCIPNNSCGVGILPAQSPNFTNQLIWEYQHHHTACDRHPEHCGCTSNNHAPKRNRVPVSHPNPDSTTVPSCLNYQKQSSCHLG